MRKHSGKYIALFTLVMILLSGMTVFAETGHVYDDGMLFTDAQVSELEAMVITAEGQTGWEFYLVTTDDAEGKTATEYADDFFDTHSTIPDGVCILIDMDNREIYLSTAGDAIYYLTDSRVESVLDDGYDYVAGGDYYQCMVAMTNGVLDYYDRGIPSNQYTYDTETGKVIRNRSITGGEILFAVIIGIAVGVIIFVAVIGKYRLKWGGYKYDYRQFGKLNLTRKEDQFINQTLTHRRIETSSSSGGGGGRSSVHTSSGGVSHGGGGRKF